MIVSKSSFNFPGSCRSHFKIVLFIGKFALGCRSQRVGTEGEPENRSYIFSTSMGKSLGLGFSILNEKILIETQTWITVVMSYQAGCWRLTLCSLVKKVVQIPTINTQGL